MAYTGKKLETKLYDVYTKDEVDSKESTLNTAIGTKVNTADIQTLVETYSPAPDLTPYATSAAPDFTGIVQSNTTATGLGATPFGNILAAESGAASSRSTCFLPSDNVSGDVSASVWWGNSNGNPVSAIDGSASSVGGMSFWANNGTSWLQTSYNHGNGNTYFNNEVWLNGGGTSARLWTQANETGMNYGGHAATHVWMDNAWFREATWGAERSWDNYPGITSTNDTREGPIGEFRIHGIMGVSGGDFSVATRSDGGFITGSDSRRKTNIESISDSIEVIKQLDGKRFNILNQDLDIEQKLSKAEGVKFGFIAQEIENVIPEAVKYDPTSTVLENGWASQYSVDYGSVVALLTNAIKEQQAMIEDLQNRVQGLEGA